MQSHSSWLNKAQEELAVAHVLVREEFFGAATYHCQQSAEKALKAYLVFQAQQIMKTHDLLRLLELCMEFEPGFQVLYEPARALSPFSTKFRYPSEFDIPDRVDAELAVQQAEEILLFTRSELLK